MMLKQRLPLIGWILFFAGLLLVLFINIKSPYNIYDEGFAVLGGERVLRGEAPYKDFWALYPPGQFYLLAGSYKLLGSSVLSARIYDTFVRFAIVLCAYIILRRLTSWLPALVITLILAFMLAAVKFYSYAVFPALALTLGAFLAFIRFASGGGRRWLGISGLIVGLAALVRLDLGAYAAVSIASAAFLLQFLRLWQVQGEPQTGFKRFASVFWCALRESLIFPAALLLVFLPVYGLVILRSGWSNVVEQLLVFPATGFHEQRWLPYPALNPFANPSLRPWYEFYLPLLLFALTALYFIVRLFLGKRASQSQSLTALALAAFGALVFAQALSRYDYIHVLPSTVLALICAAVLFYALGHDFNGIIARGVLPLMLLGLLWLYWLPTFEPIDDALRNYPPYGCYSQLEKAGCAPLSTEQQQAAQYIQANTTPDERIYSGNTRHDSIFVNDVGFYFIADRMPGTRYHELHPGVATTLPVQQEIARNLEQNNVRWAVLFDIWQSQEPNGSRESSGVVFLDQYLRENFEIVNQYGMYQIWRRKN